MTPEQLLERLDTDPDRIEFTQVMDLISRHYNYTPTRFTNGVGARMLVNEAGSNEGSCKIFALGQLLGLDESRTLACFGRYYREDVLSHPGGTDHMNIRTFMRHGWGGIRFEQSALRSSSLSRS
jgi:hypothetical protein